MIDKIPLYVIGLPKDEPVNELLVAKFEGTLEKVKKILPEIIEAKISVKSQNPEGSRTHYDVTSTVTTSKNQLIYTESGWDILKICDELCRKLEGNLSKHDDKRQRESIRKKEREGY
ncbi:MAG: HPF/RaiA family ribosome-associated protein [Nitrosopumilus sp.]